MQTITLNEDQITTLRGALELAKDKYVANAASLREEPGHERLAEQFDRQADDSSKLLEILD